MRDSNCVSVCVCECVRLWVSDCTERWSADLMLQTFDSRCNFDVIRFRPRGAERSGAERTMQTPPPVARAVYRRDASVVLTDGHAPGPTR